MRWALVPPKPKALIPARRGVGVRGQGAGVVLTWKGVVVKLMSGLGCW